MKVMGSFVRFVAFLSLIGQFMAFLSKLHKTSLKKQVLHEIDLVSYSSVAFRVRSKVMERNQPNAYYTRYGQLGLFISKLLQGVTVFNYSSAPQLGGHVLYEFFDYLPREEESARIVKLFNDRRRIRREKPYTKLDKGINPLISLPGAPGSGKSAFLAHFPESQAYKEYTKSSEIVFVSTMSFNSCMEGGEPAFGLRVLYGFLRAMGLLSPSFQWANFYDEYKEYKDIKVDEVINLIKSFLDSRTTSLEFLVLVDELSKSEELVSRVDFPVIDPKKVPAGRIMSEIGLLLSNYDNVNVVVSSLSPNFIEDLLIPGNIRPIEYVIPKALMGSLLGSTACRNRTDSLLELAKAANHTPDATNVKIFENMYLLLSGHPRSLEYMAKVLEDNNEDWVIRVQELCKSDNKHCGFLRYVVFFLQEVVKTLPSLSSGGDENISKFIFAAQPIGSKEMGFRTLLEHGFLQIHESSYDKFVFMVPTVSVLYWMFNCEAIVLNSTSSVHTRKLYQIQQLSKNISELGLSDLMKYIVGITILAHSYERFGIGAILGGGSIISQDFSKKPMFEVAYEENMSNITDLIIPNRLYMAKKKQAGYDLRVVLQCTASDTPRHYYLQVKIKLPTSESIENMTAKMVYNTIIHYKSICPNPDFQSLYMYLYIWDNVSKDMMSQQDLINELMLLKLEDTNDTIKFINDYYDHLIIMNKSDLKKWILPSLVAIPYFLQEVTGQIAEM